MQSHFDQQHGYVITKLTGSQTLQSLQAAYFQLCDHPQYRKGLNRIWVLDDATICDMSTDDLREILCVANKEQNASEIKVAMVAPKDVDYGLCREARAISDGIRKIDFMVYRNLEEAKTWMTSTQNDS